MANDDFDAGQTAYIGYALVHALLSELEKESPGIRKRVWLRAQESLEEYGYLDAQSADWVAAKIADL
jgi:hypothetical protein